MNTTSLLVQDLEQRGITAHDVEDVVQALMTDSYRSANSDSSTDVAWEHSESIAADVSKLTATGLVAQIGWLESYFGNEAGPRDALAAYLAVPIAA